MNLTALWPEGSPDAKVPEQKGLNEVRVVTECKPEHFSFNLIISDEPAVGPHSCSGSHFGSRWEEAKTEARIGMNCE